MFSHIHAYMYMIYLLKSYSMFSRLARLRMSEHVVGIHDRPVARLVRRFLAELRRRRRPLEWHRERTKARQLSGEARSHARFVAIDVGRRVCSSYSECIPLTYVGGVYHDEDERRTSEHHSSVTHSCMSWSLGRCFDVPLRVSTSKRYILHMSVAAAVIICLS